MSTSHTLKTNATLDVRQNLMSTPKANTLPGYDFYQAGNVHLIVSREDRGVLARVDGEHVVSAGNVPLHVGKSIGVRPLDKAIDLLNRLHGECEYTLRTQD